MKSDSPDMLCPLPHVLHSVAWPPFLGEELHPTTGTAAKVRIRYRGIASLRWCHLNGNQQAVNPSSLLLLQ